MDALTQSAEANATVKKVKDATTEVDEGWVYGGGYYYRFLNYLQQVWVPLLLLLMKCRSAPTDPSKKAVQAQAAYFSTISYNLWWCFCFNF